MNYLFLKNWFFAILLFLLFSNGFTQQWRIFKETDKIQSGSIVGFGQVKTGDYWFGLTENNAPYTFKISVLTDTVWSSLGLDQQYFNGKKVCMFYIDKCGDKWFVLDSLNLKYTLLKYNDTSYFVFNNTHGLGNGYISSVYEDRNTGDFWVLQNDGIARRNGNSFVFIPFNGVGIVKRIAIDNQGNIWFISNSKLAKYNGSTWNYIYSSLFPYDCTYEDVIINRNGEVIVSTSEGCFKYNGTNWSNYNLGENGSGHIYVADLYVDKQGNVWGSTQNGIACDKPSGMRIELPNIGGCISQDENGDFWFCCTNSVKAYKYSGGKIYQYDSDQAIASNFVKKIVVDDLGRKWICCGKEIRIYDEKKEVKWLKGLFTPSASTNSIEFDRFHRAWILIDQGTFRILDFMGNNISPYGTLPYNFTDTVKALKIDGNNKKWFATKNGLVLFNDTVFKRYNRSNSGICGNNVTSLAIDISNNIWLGTSDNGVSKFNGVTWTNYNNYSTSGRLLGNNIFCLAIDPAGCKWFGTDKGVSKLCGNNWISYSRSNTNYGLPSDTVCDIVFDENGNKWFSTNYGVVRFDDVNWSIYDVKSGLTDNRVRSIAFDQSNNTWIGTDNGLCMLKSCDAPSIPHAIQINGADSVLVNSSNNLFSTPVLQNATSYIWNFPGNITYSGSNNSINVNAGMNAQNGIISVQGKNACGKGIAAFKPLFVKGIIWPQTFEDSVYSPANWLNGSVNNYISNKWEFKKEGVSNFQFFSSNCKVISSPEGGMFVAVSNGYGFSSLGRKKWLISPRFHVSPNSILNFWLRKTSQYIDTISVKAGTVFQSHDSLNINLLTLTFKGNFLDTGWVNYSIPLDTLENKDVYLGFIQQNNGSTGGDLLMLDNIRVTDCTPANALGIISNIQGDSIVKRGSINVRYSIDSVPNAQFYIWKYPKGFAGKSISNKIELNVSDSAQSGFIKVYAYDYCGNIDSSSFFIKTTSLKIQDTVSGNRFLCAGQSNVVYKVSPVLGALYYDWFLPSGINGVSDNDSIIVNISNQSFNGEIRVRARNNNDTSNFAIILVKVFNLNPSDISSVFGIDTLCAGFQNQVFKAGVSQNVGLYEWILPLGFSGVSTNDSISINIGTIVGSDTLKVRAVNGCGVTPYFVKVIQILPLPSKPVLQTNSLQYCNGIGSLWLKVQPVNSAINYSWALSQGFIGSSLNDSIFINVNSNANLGTFEVKALNGCGFGEELIDTIKIIKVPPIADTIWGEIFICGGGDPQGIKYNVANIPFATSYQWNLSSGSIGASTYDTILIKFPNSNRYDTISVRGSNICGIGPEKRLIVTNNYFYDLFSTQIISPSTVCSGQNGVLFKVNPIIGGAKYRWNLPNNIIGWSDSNSIRVNIVSGFYTPFTIGLSVENACSEKYLTKNIVIDQMVPKIGDILGKVNVCQGQTQVEYQVPFDNGITIYDWVLPFGANGSQILNKMQVNYSENAKSGFIKVRGRNSCGVGDSSFLKVKVFSLPTSGIIEAPVSAYQGQSDLLISVQKIKWASVYSWNSPSGFSGLSDSKSVLYNVNTNAQSGNIIVRGGNDCGYGVLNSKYIEINNDIPHAAGIISGDSSVCRGASNVVFHVSPITNATSYIWVLPLGVNGFSNTNSISLSFDSTFVEGYLKVRGENSFGEGVNSVMIIKAYNALQPPLYILGPSSICQGSVNVGYSANLINGADSYLWTFPTGITYIGNSASILANISNNSQSGNISVRVENGCGLSAPFTTYLHVKKLPDSAGIIMGPSILQNNGVSAIYSVLPIPNSIMYNWILPSGYFGSSTNDSIEIVVMPNASSEIIKVNGINECGNGAISAKPITVGGQIPASAGVISGSTSVCQGQQGVQYQVGVISGANEYVWILPNGDSIITQANSLTISASNNIQSGYLKVKGKNANGYGTESVLGIFVKRLPEQAQNIFGLDSICQSGQNIIYSTSGISFATSYLWNFLSSGSVQSLDSTFTFNVFPNTQSGLIIVKGVNECGVGLPFQKAIVVKPLPIMSGIINGPLNVCKGSEVEYMSPASLYADSIHWFVPTGIIGQSDSSIIRLLISQSAQSNNLMVSGVNHCGAGNVISVQLNVLPSIQPPVVTQIGSQLISSVGVGNQWYSVAGGAVNGEINKIFLPTADGDYYVKYYNGYCWSENSNIIHYQLGSIHEECSLQELKIFPNPVKTQAKVEFLLPHYSKVEAFLLDEYGRELKLLKKGYFHKGIFSSNIDAENLVSGIYYCCIKIDNLKYVCKIIIIK